MHEAVLTWRIAALLGVFTNPEHEERQNFLDRIGGTLDPARFDTVAVNVALQHVR